MLDKERCIHAFDGDMDISFETDGEMSISNDLDGEYGDFRAVTQSDTYTGETEVTPSEEIQILYTEGKLVVSNITINPIPNNYGLITWTGSHLIVS